MNRECLCLLFFWIGCSPLVPIRNPHSSPSTAEGTAAEALPLRILAIDIGQGDATLVTGPTGRTLLIDAGPQGSGLAEVLPALRAEEIKDLDWILATHYDADHIGGIPEVLDNILPSRALIDRGDFTDKATPTYEKYLESLSRFAPAKPDASAQTRGSAPAPPNPHRSIQTSSQNAEMFQGKNLPANREEAEAGKVLDLGGGAEARVIVANGRYADGRSVHLNPDEENEASIGLLIRYGAFSYFTAGDLPGGGSPGGYETKDLETTAGEIIGDIDVLHVSHHGSSSSTNEDFLLLTRPEAAVISVGKDNEYGHPTETVLQRLDEIGAEVYRTDLLGDLEINTDGETYEIKAR